MTRKNFLHLVIFVFVLAGGIGLRLYHLGSQSLWTDEIAAILISGRSILEILITIAVQDVNPPLYYLLLHFWQMGGDSEFWLRLLSVLFSGGSILGIWLVAKKLYGPLTALFASILLAFSPLSVYLSQEVRYYTLLEMLTVASFFGYLKIREGKSGGWLALPMLLGLYTHYYFILILFCLLAWFLIDFRDREIQDRQFARPMLVSVMGWAPWILAVALQASRGSFRFRPKIGMGEMFLDLTTFLTLGHADHLHPLKEGSIDSTILLCSIPFLLLLGAFAFGERKKRSTWQVLLWLFLPVVSVALLSRFIHLYGHRYFVIVLPALALALGAGIQILSKVRLSLLALVVILFLQGGSLLSYFQEDRYWREDWRGLAAFVQANEREGDGLLFYNEAQAGPFDYYYQGALPREYVLTGDPFVFHQEPQEAIEKRLDTYFKKYRRLFFLAHYGHMYEPAGHTESYVDKHGFFDDLPDCQAEFRIPMQFVFTSRKNAFRALWKSYDPFIDFSKGNYHTSQLDGDLTHLTDPWVWMGKWARFYLRRPGNEKQVRLKIMADLKYHETEILMFFVLADGKPIKTFSIRESGEHEFLAELPPIQGELVEVGLFTKQTFNPRKFFGGEDESPKSFLVGYVGVE